MMRKIVLAKLPAPLKSVLKTADAWLRLQEGVRWLFPVIAVGLAITLVLVWVGRLYPLTFPLVLVLIGLALTFLGLLFTWLYLWYRPRSPLSVARLLDRRLGLEERLSTSVELTALKGHHIPTSLVQAQLEDTIRHLQTIKPAQHFPLRFSWRWAMVAAILLVMIILCLLLPNPQITIIQQQARNEEILKEEVAQLEKIQAELLAEQPLLETPEGQKLRQTLDEL